VGPSFFRRKAAVSILILSFVGMPATAYAQDAQTTQTTAQSVSNTQNDGEDVTQAQIDTHNRLNAAIAKQNSVATKINSLDRTIKTIQQQVDDAQNAYNAAQASYETAHDEFLAKQKVANASTKRVRLQAADLVAGRTVTESAKANMFLSASSVQDLQRRQVVMGAVADYHKQVLDDAIVAKKSAQKANDDAQAALDLAQKKRDEMAQAAVQLQEQRATLASLNNQATANAASQAALLSQQEGQKVEYLSRLKEIDSESSSISSLLQGAQLQAGATPGRLAWPLETLIITSPFGPRVHPIYGTVRMHTGTDFKGGTGTPIKAAGDGSVVYSGVMNGYGNVVIISHGGGLATLYAHQSVRYAQVGQQVKTGDIIGLIGATGNVTGPHLHFEVRVNGTPVNPIPYLGIAN
jgi:murein DD-endopeptidase MepM/ murein hydrolase activator NlpD